MKDGMPVLFLAELRKNLISRKKQALLQRCVYSAGIEKGIDSMLRAILRLSRRGIWRMMTVMTLREVCDSYGVSRRAVQGYLENENQQKEEKY